MTDATTSFYLRSRWIARRESDLKQHKGRRAYFKHSGKSHILSLLSSIWNLIVSYFCYSRCCNCQPMQTWISAHLLRLTVSYHNCPQGFPSDPKTTWLSSSAGMFTCPLDRPTLVQVFTSVLTICGQRQNQII